MEEKVKDLIETIIEQQREKVLRCGRMIIPQLTTDDVLQPNDFPELEKNPFFRYEEGVLEGMHTIEAALRALFKDLKFK